MKFHFKNLGTIKKTTLDLRPLTVIVGPNNTSKTYLAYCVHGLLQAMARQPFPAVVSLPSGPRKVVLKVDKVIAAVVEQAQPVLSAIADDVAAHLSEYFQDTHGQLFRRTELDILLEKNDVRDALRGMAVYDHNMEVNDEEIIFHLTSGPHLVAEEWLSKATDVMTRALLCSPSYTLPAERNAFIMTYKVLSARRYRLLRDRERSVGIRLRTSESLHQLKLFRDPSDIRYPAPIEDFLDFLTDVELEKSGPKNDPTSAFGKLTQAIENHIQGGHRTEYQPTELGGRELMVTVNESLRIDLYNASSSIKQLAPLLLYLRYRAEPNQVLIIDEPEMNLHPEAQAKLLEALGMLANLGVHVLLTTHSPYFMAHLNNLIASDQKSPARKKRQAKHLYMGDPAAFLAPEDVSAYEMRPEGLVSLADPEYGIRWDTLSDVSGELQRRHFAIVEEPTLKTKKGSAAKGLQRRHFAIVEEPAGRGKTKS